jgi:hypothetical protein
MDEEKRMVGSYEIKHAICIGDKEILFGEDESKADSPYMACDCTWDNPLGIDCYGNGVGSSDYLEIMTVFLSRIHTQIDAMKAERNNSPTPLQPFTPEHCNPNDYSKSIENKVVVIRASCLRPEYRTAANQLVLATGGFGTYGNARGRAVNTVNLYSGKEARWNRGDIQGVLKPEYMPDWAKERLKQIYEHRRQAEKQREQER